MHRPNISASPGSQITRTLSFGLSDLLLLPARKRFAAGELERLQEFFANELLTLAAEVEAAWFESVSADPDFGAPVRRGPPPGAAPTLKAKPVDHASMKHG